MTSPRRSGRSKPKNGRWTVGWGFSARCDLSCPFCYSGQVRRTIDEHELPISAAEGFLRRNADSIASLNFGTGECFLSPVFPQLLAACRRILPAARVAVTTNGAITDAVTISENYETVASCLHELDVSLDFADRARHDELRGREGTWSRALRAVQLGREMGLRTSIVAVGTKETLERQNLMSLLDLAFDMDACLRINLYMPTDGDLSFAPPVDTVWDLLDAVHSRCARIWISDRLLGSVSGFFSPGPRLAAARSCRILPDGGVTPSTYLIRSPWVVRAELEDVGLQGLEAAPPFRAYASHPLPESCNGCTFADSCHGGSVERRWLWWGRLDRADPFCPGPDAAAELAGRSLEPVDEEPEDVPQIHLDYLPTILFSPSLERSVSTGSATPRMS